jgi:hypothetical protein
MRGAAPAGAMERRAIAATPAKREAALLKLCAMKGVSV